MRIRRTHLATLNLLDLQRTQRAQRRRKKSSGGGFSTASSFTKTDLAQKKTKIESPLAKAFASKSDSPTIGLPQKLSREAFGARLRLKHDLYARMDAAQDVFVERFFSAGAPSRTGKVVLHPLADKIFDALKMHGSVLTREQQQEWIETTFPHLIVGGHSNAVARLREAYAKAGMGDLQGLECWYAAYNPITGEIESKQPDTWYRPCELHYKHVFDPVTGKMEVKKAQHMGAFSESWAELPYGGAFDLASGKVEWERGWSITPGYFTSKDRRGEPPHGAFNLSTWKIEWQRSNGERPYFGSYDPEKTGIDWQLPPKA